MYGEIKTLIENLKVNIFSIEKGVNTLDEMYNSVFCEEGLSICDNFLSEIEHRPINEGYLQDIIVINSSDIKTYIQQRKGIEFRNGINYIVERAKLNAKIDALSSINLHLTHLISEKARNAYILRNG